MAMVNTRPDPAKFFIKAKMIKSITKSTMMLWKSNFLWLRINLSQ
jgi:hypothetical protein